MEVRQLLLLAFRCLPIHFDCSSTGNFTVTLTVTDASSNTAACTADLLVQDSPPLAICQNATVVLDGSGNGSIATSDIDNGSSDDCGITTYSLSQSAFSCSDLGDNTVTLTVTDTKGQTDDCTAVVDVQDNSPPSFLPVANDIILDANGTVTIFGSDYVQSGSETDNCGIVSYTVTPNTFDCTPVGLQGNARPVIDITAFDAAGNASATQSARVNVLDVTAPTMVCQPVTLQLDASGSATLVASDVDGGSSDACGITSFSLSKTAYDCSDLGVSLVTLTAEDGSGNDADCSASVTVVDEVAPTPLCQNLTIQLDGNGSASIVASQVDNGSSDNCPGSLTLSLDNTSFDCSNTGANTVVLTVTDAQSNTASCSATITVEDNILPVALCKNATVQLDANGNASLSAAQVDNGSSDNCTQLSLSVSPSTFDCSQVGNNNATLTVTDNSNNSASCSAVVKVEDNVLPTALCNPLTVSLDGSGNYALTATEVDAGSSDNCPNWSLAISPNTFDCNTTGIQNVTLTVTDANNNSASCISNVTVVDDEAPSALCKNVTLNLDANGQASLLASDVNNGSTDNCSVASLSASPSAFSCNEVGDNTVTLTVTDPSSNVGTCTAVVNVRESLPPVAVCSPLTVQLDANGQYSLTASDLDGGSTDNCGITNYSANPSSFGCSNVGSNTVVLTVSDGSGNTASCNSFVTVEDLLPPVPVCNAITVDLDPSGNYTLTTADVASLGSGSSDNCGIQSLSASPSVFDCDDATSSPTVTLTVTDQNNNTADCAVTITVQDVTPPTALCQPATVTLDGSGNASAAVSDIDNGSSDACGIASRSISPTTFGCKDVGATTTVTLTVTDNNGNTASCSSNVTVIDNQAPAAVCSPFTVQLDGDGNGSLAGSQVDGGSTDNCSIAGFTVSPASFGCNNTSSPVNVTLTVNDAANNTASCIAVVTVEDNVDPTAICQNSPIVELDANGQATIVVSDINNGSSDACDLLSLSISPSVFDCQSVGSQAVTLTVVDNNNNSATCTSNVDVQDNVAPTASCQDVTLQLDNSGNATLAASQVDNGSSDACGQVSLSVSPTTYDCADVFNTNVAVLTVTDVNGNTSSCTATITVEDNIAPFADCIAPSVELDINGQVSIAGSDVDRSSSDNCPNFTLSVSPSQFDCEDLGAQNVTLTVTDASGNTSSCSTTVTVQDKLSPLALCQPVTVALDNNNQASIASSDVDRGSTDNCQATLSLSVSPSVFDCSDLGPNTVVLTVTDQATNSSSCNAVVTVEDNTDPVALCTNFTVDLNTAGSASISTTDIDNGSSDNCVTVSLSVSPSTFGCSDVGDNTVVLTVTDGSNNTASCNAVVTVNDVTPPIALCQTTTVSLDVNGVGSITAQDIDNTSIDACGIKSLAVSPSTFGCANVGSPTVTLTVTDNNDNSSTCSVSITVEDNVKPTAACKAITVQLDGSGQASIAGSDIDAGSSDACDIASLSASPSNFSCANLGSNTVLLTVTDNNGNTASCAAAVTVEDNLAPTALCQDLTISLDANGSASIVASQVDNGSSDNCAVTSYTVAPNSFGCSNVGPNTVVLTVSDASNNSASCNAVVTVEDNTAPTALCQDLTISLDAGGSASIAGSDVDNSSSDACGTVSLSVNPSSFGCSDVGDNTVTLTVTDPNNNTAICTSVVTVEDVTDPVAVCQDVTLQLDNSGNATLAASQVDNGSSDACGQVSLSVSPTTYDCADVFNSNVAVLTVTDVNGNTSSCTAAITVEDNIDPFADCIVRASLIVPIWALRM
jgi:hypothetical protein